MDRKNEAYLYIKNAIINNDFPQGSPLREVDISSTLKMSRSPVREALRDLESEGVVISYPARGTFVATITPYDVEEIYELRAMFEIWALQKAFFRITEEELTRIEKQFIATSEPFDWEAYHQADRDFHQLYIDKCGSRRLALFVSTLNTQVERIRRYSDKNTGRSIKARLAEHLHIIECIRRRDLDASIEALRLHLKNVSDAAIETCRIMMMEQNTNI